MKTIEKRKADGASGGSISRFLSGAGPNPVPKNEVGPLGKTFLEGVDAEIAAQDIENERQRSPTAAEELVALLRLVGDNREMIDLIKEGRCGSVSDIATKMGRELSNVSRTLSKMAAYGLVGFERDEERRSKRPVWLLPVSGAASGSDWIEVYCIARSMRSGGISSLEPSAFAAFEEAIHSTVEAAAIAFDRIAIPAAASRSKGALA